MRDIRGLPQSQTDPDGNTTDYTYDEAGQPAVTVAPAVSAETYGSAAAQVRPVTTDGYDTFGEETQSEDPDGNVTNTVYDAEGNTVSQTLPNYTPPGASTPITATTVWAYDKENQLLSEQDPLTHTTAYTYDQMGDVATETAPDGGLTHHTYDPIGEPLVPPPRPRTAVSPTTRPAACSPLPRRTPAEAGSPTPPANRSATTTAATCSPPAALPDPPTSPTTATACSRPQRTHPAPAATATTAATVCTPLPRR